MRNVKSIAVAALTLTLICAVVVAALAGTNLLTKGPIEENERIATENACKAVMPTAATFETVDGTFADGVVAVYEGKDADGASTGYVVKTSTRGKSKDLVLMTAVAADGTVFGIEVVSESETAGYMNKVKKDGLFDRLVGVSEEFGAVAGVAGATKTTKGVKDGVSLAVDAVKEVVARGALLPTATVFTAVDGNFADGVVAVYEGNDAAGTLIGYVVKTSVEVENARLVLLTVVSADGTAGETDILSGNENAVSFEDSVALAVDAVKEVVANG